MDKEKLKQILFNVNHLGSHITHSKAEVEKIDYKKHSQVFTDVHRLLDIFICSLLDELKVFEKFEKEADNYYISDTLYVITPLVNYLKRFDSLKVKRNKILAHHNRDRRKLFKPWWKELEGKRFATTDDEEKMIFSTVRAIHKIFVNRFPEELEEVLAEYDKEIDDYEEKMKAVPDVEAYEDINSTLKEVKRRMIDREFYFTIVGKKRTSN